MSEARTRSDAVAPAPRHRAGPIFAACAAAAVLLLVPRFTNAYVQYVINLALINALVALGFNILLGYIGQLAFANAAFFGIGAYTTGILMERFGVPFPLALACSAIVGGASGLLVGMPALRLKGYYLAIVTLVFGELMRWIYIHGGDITKGSTGLGVPTPAIGSLVLETDASKYYLFLVVTVGVVWATMNLLRSRIGRSWVAVRENEPAAASLGFSPARHIVGAFGWSGLVVAVAGSMFAVLLGRIAPESFNLHQLLVQFAFVMIGGLGSVTGSVLGALLLTAAPELLRNFPGFEEIFFSLLLIFALLFMKRGLYGLIVDHYPRFRERLYRR